MSTHILRGSKQEVAANLARINGETFEAIVFVDEIPAPTIGSQNLAATDIFSEMRPYMVDVADLDDSREVIYSRLEGE